ncbi:hypothetical protein TSUD_38520 [Trifolium subterraneum]|uniref:Uncharacterized protein n=1 Tax=Trifolium subterraneum TaxID=3900 RepID=A0A2Z6N6X2_TRISU|nr:hypothetical protein TSUD_38520 [Trifolium subterraneum]
MESKVEKAMLSFNPEPKTTLDHNPQPNSILNKKPSKRSKNIFKVALLMMRGNSRKSTKAVFPVDDESKSIWRKVVGSMRPMHLQSDQSPPQIINGENNLKKMIIEKNNINVDIQGEDGFNCESESSLPQSPDSSRYASTTNSLYASAIGLNEMVEEEKEEEIVNNEDTIIGDDGDDMIDAKAEEFIAQFYQEMRLQRMDSVDDPRYNEISMRSLGL